MKKLLMIALASLTLTIPVKADLNDVEEFLKPYCNENDALEVKEFYDVDKPDVSRKALLVEYTYSADAKEENIGLYNRHERDDIFLDMTKQDWFDYTSIQFLKLTNEYGIGIYEHIFYFLDSGTYLDYDTDRAYTWIIKTGDEIDGDLKTFLGLVADELLKANGIWGNLEIGMGGENSLNFHVCDKLAAVSGTCEVDGKTYNFVTEFTYKYKSKYDGEYDTIYVGVNDVPLYGEYTEIEKYSWNRNDWY